MQFQFDSIKLFEHSQHRGKIYLWSQILNYTDKLPSQIIQKSKIIKTNPSFYLTQSGKNYISLDTHLRYFPNPENFTPTFTPIGLQNRLTHSMTGPAWVYLSGNQNILELKLQAINYAKWMYLFPGVKKIYLIGSVAESTGRSSSDIDFIIMCHKNTVLICRLWVKIWIKIIGMDVHSTWVEIKSLFNRYLKFKISGTNNDIKSKKIDVGMFYETEQDVQKYYPVSERYSWLYCKEYIPPEWIKYTDLNSENNLCFHPKPQKILSLKFLKYITFLICIPTFPVSWLQILWFQIKQDQNPNITVKKDFISFYPRYGASKKEYLTKNLV